MMKKLSLSLLLLATMFAATAQNRFPHNLPIELRAATAELTVDGSHLTGGNHLQMVSDDAVEKIVEPPNKVVRPERPAPAPRKTTPSSVENIELTAFDLRSADTQPLRKASASSSSSDCEFCAEFLNPHRIFPYSRVPTFMPLPIPETVSVRNTGTETLVGVVVEGWLNNHSSVRWASSWNNRSNLEPRDTTTLAWSRPSGSIPFGSNNLWLAIYRFQPVSGFFSWVEGDTHAEFIGTDDGLFTVDRFGIDVTSGGVLPGNGLGNFFQITKDVKLNSVGVALGSFDPYSLNFTVSIHEVLADLTLGNLLHEEPATFEFPELMRIYWTQVDIPSLNLPEGLYFVSITHDGGGNAGLVGHLDENVVTYGIYDGVLQQAFPRAAAVRLVIEERVDLWSFSGDTLFINTVGDMFDYGTAWGQQPPWQGLVASTRTLIIGDDVTRIGNNAFRNFSNLTSVIIGNSVTTIGNGAFGWCSGLTSVTIPNSVTTIGNSAFEWCSGLTSVIIGNGVTMIGNRAFADCRSLTSIDLPNSVQHVDHSAFAGTTLVTSLTLPSSIISLGENPFPTILNLTVPWNTPISIETTAFPNRASMVLTVPQGAVDTYRTTAVWRDFAVITDNATVEFEGFSGSGTEEDPFLIGTAEDLARLAFLTNRADTAFWNKHYRLVADIDLSDFGANFNDGRGWIPIGLGVSAPGGGVFLGVFDGNNHTITGLYINDQDLSRAGLSGLFGDVRGVVKNLRLVDVDIHIREGGAIAGLVCGLIINSYSSGTVSGANNVGGIAGWAQSISSVQPVAAIVNSSSSARVSGSQSVGGIVGFAFGGCVVNSSFTGVVSGNWNTGGIAGHLARGSIANSYSTDSVIGNNQVGGVVGGSTFGGMTFDASIENSFATGVVVGVSDVGGVVGRAALFNEFDVVSVTSSAALNPSVYGNTNVGRIAGSVVLPSSFPELATGEFILSGNRALNSLVDRDGQTTSWTDKTHDGIGGADMTQANALSASFWTNPANWQGQAWNTDFWNFVDGQLPTHSGVLPFSYAVITLSDQRFFYDGTAKMPTVTVRFGGATLTEGTDFRVAITSTDGPTTSAGTQTGVVALTVTGIGGYTGQHMANFIILNPMRGSGTENDPFLITASEQLAYVAQRVNARDTAYWFGHYRLLETLDLSAYGENFNNGRGWISIRAFRGLFDGNRNVISGLYIRNESAWTAPQNNGGLFDLVDGGTVKNLGVEDVFVKSVNASGLARSLNNNGTIENVYTTGVLIAQGATNFTNSSSAGIVTWVLGNSIVKNSYSTASCTGGASGGIVSNLEAGSQVVNSVALNPQILGTLTGPAGRVMRGNQTSPIGTLSNNYGLTSMLNVWGDSTWNNVGHNQPNGADVTMEQALTASFWTSPSNWYGGGWDTRVWNFVNGQLPKFQRTSITNPPVIATDTVSSGCTETNYSQRLATYGNDFVVWALTSGQLPDGLNLFNTGLIAGRPSRPGTFDFTAGAFNPAGADSIHLTIVIDGESSAVEPPTITTASLPNGVVDGAYTQTLVSSGNPAIVWALESGNLPSDVELYSDGTIAGTPSRAGEFTFTALVVNEAGFDTKEFTITIQPGDATNVRPMEEGPRVASLQALITDGKLQVSGLIVGQRWTVYSVLGTRVFQGFATGETAEITLPIHGTYIIQQNNRTVKIVY